MENKAKFIEAIGAALRDYSRECVVKAEYIEVEKKRADGTRTFITEIARITYQNGYTKDISVSGSSCLAILHDIFINLV